MSSRQTAIIMKKVKAADAANMKKEAADAGNTKKAAADAANMETAAVVADHKSINAWYQAFFCYNRNRQICLQKKKK